MSTLSLSGLKNAFDYLLKLKKAFNALRQSDYFIKEFGVSDIVEKYFAYESLPKSKISLHGRLAQYIPNPNLPIYSPQDLKNVQVTDISEEIGQIRVQTAALNVPSIMLNPIILSDGSIAKILWLYPSETKGLIFSTTPNVGLSKENLNQLFPVEFTDKPIPVIFDFNSPVEQFLYKEVKIIGKIIAAPREQFDAIVQSSDFFSLNFFSNCFRPFSNNEGVLAIDARRPDGRIEELSSQNAEFNIVYSVQGIVNVDDEINLSKTMSQFLDYIPDRQGLPKQVKSFTVKDTLVNSIISDGDISWQYSEASKCFASYIVVDVANPVDVQTKLTKLSAHWQTWQKLVNGNINDGLNTDSRVQTLLCSNKVHDRIFNSNGLQMPKVILDKLLNDDSSVRESIDWLEISLGKIS